MASLTIPGTVPVTDLYADDAGHADDHPLCLGWRRGKRCHCGDSRRDH
jgi:hypothetical protein